MTIIVRILLYKGYDSFIKISKLASLLLAKMEEKEPRSYIIHYKQGLGVEWSVNVSYQANCIVKVALSERYSNKQITSEMYSKYPWLCHICRKEPAYMLS